MNHKAKKLSLTTQIIRIAWVIWAAVIGVFFVYNYHLNTTTFSTEVERNFDQTSQIVKQLMENHLQSVQVSQDITSKSRTLIDSFQALNLRAIDSFMREVEEFAPNNSPDLRFLYQYGKLTWEDGKNEFFGISSTQLLALAKQVHFNNKWYFLNVTSKLGLKHLMLRRVVVVDSYTGEVVGYYFIGLVLDNNVSFLQQLSSDANIKQIMLEEDGVVIAQSGQALPTKPQPQGLVLPSINSTQHNIVREITLQIDGVDTPITALFIQDTLQLEGVEYRMATSLIVLLLTMSLLAIWFTRSVNRRIEKEITGVMHLADSFDSTKKNIQFIGSNFIEFDRLGQTLEASIRREKEKDHSLRNLFEFSLLPTILVDEHLDIVSANPAAKHAFDDDLTSLRAALLKICKQAFSEKAQAKTDTSIDGVIYSWSVSPILVENTKPVLVVQGQNITQYIEAERQSELARKEAERNALARAEFIAKVSHEIRTPLNGILGMAQLLKQQVTTQAEKQQTEVLLQSSQHLLELLNDILDFSRIDKGAMVLERVEFSLHSIVENISAFAKPSCGQKDLIFTLHEEFERDVVVKSDPLRLTQILLNLVSNAIKFTPQGEVNVTIRLSDDGVNRGQLYMQVKDTGIGISKPHQKAVFYSFTQADSNISRKFGGSGLGLSIVDSLVKQFSGTIQLNSEPDKGSEFTVQIPIERIVKKSQVAPPELPDFACYNGLNVLLVEDNKTNAFVIQSMCHKKGMHIEWVMDGLQAVEILKAKTFDLILMDNQMPNLDGVDATQIIRQHLGLSVPIIACTADGFDETAHAFRQAGANQVLVKPILEQALFEAITEVVELNNNQRL